MEKFVYYLTGMRGTLKTGVAIGLLKRGYKVCGRELVGDFKSLNFQNQIDLICDDLRHNFWSTEARVIANSFGAYLFLHAQSQMEPYVGRVTLLSPIVGEFGNGEGMMNFIPPRSEKLFQLAQAGVFPTPKQCEIHVGSDDWQSNPASVQKLGSMLGVDVTVVPNAGHSLPKEYVGALLDSWTASA